MTAIWMTLNFLLLILAFYLILQLYQRVKDQQSDAKQETGDLEKLFAAYLEDIRKENDRVIQVLTDSAGKKRPRRKTVTRKNPSTSPETAEKASADAETASHAISFSQLLKEETGNRSQDTKTAERKKTAVNENMTERWIPPINDISDQFEESLPVRAMKLKEKGYTATQIAKELNMGNEEIELLLKFQGKKNL